MLRLLISQVMVFAPASFLYLNATRAFLPTAGNLAVVVVKLQPDAAG